ncbi:MAG TPA: ATP-dependent DNA ligase, partial [Chitinophagaceae bacterium]|nr:ATP-dependent DNA ligase [Chitinophagaceae bacterium]
MTPFAAFCNLVHLLGSSTKTNEKLHALTSYFAAAANADKVWVIALFSGRRPKRLVSSTTLQLWCTEITALPLWLFEESYHTVGDLGETIALLLPPPIGTPTCTSLSAFMLQMQALQSADETEKKTFIITNWKALN